MEKLRGEQEIGPLEQAQWRFACRPAGWGMFGQAMSQLKEVSGDAGLQDAVLPGGQHAGQGIRCRGSLTCAANVAD